MNIKTSDDERYPIDSRELSPITKLLKNFKEDSLCTFNSLSISSPNREDFGPPPAFTPSFGTMKPFNPYLS